MRPYGVKMSYRPGCACCNTKDLHFFRGLALTETQTAAKRAAKKRARLAGKYEIKQQLEN